jgi:hypothetical protein
VLRERVDRHELVFRMTHRQDGARRGGAKMAEDAISVDQLGDSVGWKLEPLFDDPRRLEELPIFDLRRVCGAVGIDWVTTLTNA